MSGILQRLGDNTLKRLYKFILKKLIGRFLGNDLLLEQLDVHLRTGEVELKNLELNVAAFEPYLTGGPFRIRRAHVGGLKVKISYSSLLSDSLLFQVNDVTLELDPRGTETAAAGFKKVDSSSKGQGSGDGSGPSGGGIDGVEGLEFVASWIEQVSTKIKLEVNKLQVRICANGSEQSLVLDAAHARLVDETPDHVSGLGSLPTGAGPSEEDGPTFLPVLVTYKRMTLERVTLRYEGSGGLMKEMASCPSASVHVKFDRKSPSTRAPAVDVDVSVQRLTAVLCPEVCERVLSLIRSYGLEEIEIAPSLASSALFLDNILQLDGMPVMETEVGEIDFKRLEALLRQYHAVKVKGLEESDCFYDCIEHEEKERPRLEIRACLRIDRFAASLLHVGTLGADLTGWGAGDHFLLSAYRTCLVVHLGEAGFAKSQAEIGELTFDNVSQTSTRLASFAPSRSPCVQVCQSAPSPSVDVICQALEMTLDVGVVARIAHFVSVASGVGDGEEDRPGGSGRPERQGEKASKSSLSIHCAFPSIDVRVPVDDGSLRSDEMTEALRAAYRRSAAQMGPESSFSGGSQPLEVMLHVRVDSIDLVTASTANTDAPAFKIEAHVIRSSVLIDGLMCFPIFMAESIADNPLVLEFRRTQMSESPRGAIAGSSVDFIHSWEPQPEVEEEINGGRAGPGEGDLRLQDMQVDSAMGNVLLRLPRLRMELARQEYLLLVQLVASPGGVFTAESGQARGSSGGNAAAVASGRKSPCIKVRVGDLAVVLHEDGPQFYSYLLRLEGVSLNVGDEAEKIVCVSAQDVGLWEAFSGSPSHNHDAGKFMPIFYGNKWVKAQSPVALMVRVKLAGLGSSAARNITVNLHDLYLRYTVESRWLARLLALVGTDDAVASGGSGSAPEQKGLSKLFITVFNGVVDYSSDARAVISVGIFRASCNLVPGADVQCFKLVARDLAVHLSHTPETLDAAADNVGIVEVPEPAVMSSSLQEYLEGAGFVQLATLNFLDALVRSKTQVKVATDSLVTVELWMGTAHIYSCRDSLVTCATLLAEWWTSVQELNMAETLANQASRARDRSLSEPVASLLSDIEEDVFGGAPTARLVEVASPFCVSERTAAGPGEKKLSEEGARNSKIVIDDYYCVAVKQEHQRREGQHLQSFGGAGVEGEAEEEQGRWLLPPEMPGEDIVGHALMDVFLEGSVSFSDLGAVDAPGFAWPEQSAQRTRALSTSSSTNDSMTTDTAERDDEMNGFYLPVAGEMELKQRDDWDVPTHDEDAREVSSVEGVEDGDDDLVNGGHAGEVCASPGRIDEQADGMHYGYAPDGAHGQVGEHESAKWFSSVGEDGSGVEPQLRIYPHHIPMPASSGLGRTSSDPLMEHPEASCGSNVQMKIIIHDVCVCWRLFKGLDWQQDAATPCDTAAHEDAMKSVPDESQHQAEVRSEGGESSSDCPRTAALLDALLEDYQADERSATGGVKSYTRYRGAGQTSGKTHGPRRRGKHARSRRGQCEVGRDTSKMLELMLQHATLEMESFHQLTGEDLLSNVVFAVKDFYVCDTLTSTRPRKVVTHWRSDKVHPRHQHQNMFSMQLTARSPAASAASFSDEYMLKVRLLPLHVSFGQHTIDFLSGFAAASEPSSASKAPAAPEDSQHTKLVNTSGAFFQSCDFGACKVKIDYQPRQINVKDLQEGNFLELLNLFPLEGVELTLGAVLQTGTLGWGNLMQSLLQSWVSAISSNQVHKFIAGARPLRPLVNVGKGVADLVLLPIQQYQRDGRILRGIKDGTAAFLQTVTVETLHTSHRMVGYLARTLDDVTMPAAGSSATVSRGLQYYDEQPSGVLQSLEYAYDSISREVQLAAQTIVAIPYEEFDVNGHGLARSVIRAVPVAVLRPMVGATQALSCTLLGFRNRMDPAMRKEEEDIWRTSGPR